MRDESSFISHCSKHLIEIFELFCAVVHCVMKLSTSKNKGDCNVIFELAFALISCGH